MSINEYEALQQRAESGDATALGEIIRIAMKRCTCRRSCFFSRRACEFLRTIGMEVVA